MAFYEVKSHVKVEIVPLEERVKFKMKEGFQMAKMIQCLGVNVSELENDWTFSVEETCETLLPLFERHPSIDYVVSDELDSACLVAIDQGLTLDETATSLWDVLQEVLTISEETFRSHVKVFELDAEALF